MTKLTFNGDRHSAVLQMEEILDCAEVHLSDILPSEWAEANRILDQGVSAVPGFYRFHNSPYAREILDCFAPDNPIRTIVVKKAAQIGFSTSVVENAIGWIMKECPGNILYLVGHEDNLTDSMDKLDKMIDGAGLRKLIQPSSKRARNTKSGDTDKRKEFAGGYLRMGTSNPKSLANFSVKFGFIDDFERMKGKSAKAGSVKSLIRQRFAAFANQYKLMYLSSPEVLEDSNIEEAYLQGDQRKYHIPCPCCGEHIVLEWETECKKDGVERAGITWRLDDFGKLIPSSVGYTCQECGSFFDDRNKSELLNAGKWIPTAVPIDPDCASFHISALNAPIYMDRWLKYVYQYLECNPPGGKRIEDKYQAFVTLVLGECYESVGEVLNANELQKNIRPYEIGIVPEKLSIADGNGRIILLTCACDLNGTEDDARIDYEVVAWSETGANYSIDHGSIGTFIPKDPGKIDRKRWSYKKGHPDCVWPELDKVRMRAYDKDTGGRVQILISGVDTGYLSKIAQAYVDSANGWVVSLKGDPEDKRSAEFLDKKTYRLSKEKNNLYLVESNVVKDEVALMCVLKWNPNYHEVQPAWFMNYPTPSGGKYLHVNFFSHYEAEERVIDDKGKFVWRKKSPNHQNHQWDNRCYNVVIKNIFLDQFLQDRKIKNGVWSDYASWILGVAKKTAKPK